MSSFQAMQNGLDRIYAAMEPRHLRCRGDFDIEGVCGWEGRESDCERLNGEPICPWCGSAIEEVKP